MLKVTSTTPQYWSRYSQLENGTAMKEQCHKQRHKYMPLSVATRRRHLWMHSHHRKRLLRLCSRFALLFLSRVSRSVCTQVLPMNFILKAWPVQSPLTSNASIVELHKFRHRGLLWKNVLQQREQQTVRQTKKTVQMLLNRWNKKNYIID